MVAAARHWVHPARQSFHIFRNFSKNRSIRFSIAQFTIMAPKRKSTQPAEEVAPARRRSTRLSVGVSVGAREIATSTPASAKTGNKKTTMVTATPSKSAKAKITTNAAVNGKAETQTQKRKSAHTKANVKAADESEEGSEPEAVEDPKESEAEAVAEEEESPEPPAKKSRTSKTQKHTAAEEAKAQAKPAKNQPKAKATTSNGTNGTKMKKGGKQQAKPSESDGEVEKKASSSTNGNAVTEHDGEGERNYWLLKAEPETRLENGIDVKFSIDDLASKTEPEPWDGIRNYVARNNLRAMKKGDLAFFYHSNCKEPGIVGTMEIVKEHSPDLSAHDPKAPYYDAKSKPSDPKWSVVHVEFRSKFAEPIGLKELRSMGDAPGKPLANMQMLKQSRLSVSKVSKEEWEYLLGVAEGRGKIIMKK